MILQENDGSAVEDYKETLRASVVERVFLWAQGCFLLSPHLQNEALSLEETRVRVVQVLGRLGGQINKNLLTGDVSWK